MLHGLGKEGDTSLDMKAEKQENIVMRDSRELDEQSEIVLYGTGVTREETEQYKQVEVILSVCVWTGLQEVTGDKLV